MLERLEGKGLGRQQGMEMSLKCGCAAEKEMNGKMKVTSRTMLQFLEDDDKV